MRIVHSTAELEAALSPRRFARETIALVPTMGNLHSGHASLIRQARGQASCVVVSVFVNPLQFAPGDDFERYPRTLDADARLADGEGADLLFAPAVADLYPAGYPPATTIHVDGLLDRVLEGEFRPGHFTGVTTVVSILFNRVRPDLAVFGEKDYQQLAVVRRMVADLGLAVCVASAPTLRDVDGLALSSRNQYLTAAERALAPQLYAALQVLEKALHEGRRDFEALCSGQKKHLESLGFQPQYLEIRSIDLEQALETSPRLVILVAAYLGKTRLIDNLQVELG